MHKAIIFFMIVVYSCSHNVKEFGADGDGVTNDSIAIQMAIDAVEHNGRGVVYFPPGTYLTNANFQLPSNIEIYGDDAIIKDTRNDMVVYYTFLINDKINIHIHDLSFDLNRCVGESWGACAVYMNEAHNVTIDNCSIIGGFYGFFCNDGFNYSNISYTNNTADTTWRWPYYIGGGAYNAKITGNYSGYCANYDGIKLSGSTAGGEFHNILISNNTVMNSYRDGIDVCVIRGDNIVIKNNTIHNANNYGIEFKVYNGGDSITNSSIRGNYIVTSNSATTSGVSVNCDYGNIHSLALCDNIISGFEINESGIKLSQCEYIIVTNNIMRGSVVAIKQINCGNFICENNYYY